MFLSTSAFKSSVIVNIGRDTRTVLLDGELVKSDNKRDDDDWLVNTISNACDNTSVRQSVDSISRNNLLMNDDDEFALDRNTSRSSPEFFDSDQDEALKISLHCSNEEEKDTAWF